MVGFPANITNFVEFVSSKVLEVVLHHRKKYGKVVADTDQPFNRKSKKRKTKCIAISIRVLYIYATDLVYGDIISTDISSFCKVPSYIIVLRCN
jgi:uncharacterized membrane protein YbaN (DUF454 family)